MAQFVVNEGVPGTQRHHVDADAYDVEGDFIHFRDEEGNRVMSIFKGAVQLIERR